MYRRSDAIELRRLIDLMEADHYDRIHTQTLKQTGFYGKAGAGCVFIAQDTGRILLPLRSRDVEQPHTWGTWGGAIDPGETPETAVRSEVRQEAGYRGHFEIIPLLVFKAPTRNGGEFRYFNYLALTETEFQPTLNWESEDARWFALDHLPSPLHFGLAALLKDGASLATIRRYAKKAAPE